MLGSFVEHTHIPIGVRLQFLLQQLEVNFGHFVRALLNSLAKLHKFTQVQGKFTYSNTQPPTDCPQSGQLCFELILFYFLIRSSLAVDREVFPCKTKEQRIKEMTLPRILVPGMICNLKATHSQ
jgi:hypothetical protein